MRRILIFFTVLVVITGCTASKSSFSPLKKYSLQQVQRDYSIYQDILEVQHPSLYWYTPRDSMDYYFNWGQEQLKDSMTESEFRKVLTYVTAKINCGHTTVRQSKAMTKFNDTVRIGRLFPLSVKTWSGKNRLDTIAVTLNLHRRDSILKRGTVITGINGRQTNELIDTLFSYISTDGYNRTHKHQSLSNTGFFGSLYSYLYGLSEKYNIEYLDSTGQQKAITIPVYDPAKDSLVRGMARRPPAMQRSPQSPSKREIRMRQMANLRQLQIDSVNKTAMMRLSLFSSGYQLKKFFRESFRQLEKNDITHLIIDVSRNGGGNVTNSTLLTRFISDHKFKLTDSLYAITRKSPHGRYIKHIFWYKLFMVFITKKKRDGNYHFGYYERHYFKPKKNNHFDGKVYIITGGNSFSASTLFVSTVIKQDNVTVVGEETGGGAYGNSAWFRPDVTLPETGVRFGLPMFRVVIDKNAPRNGRGVQPEIEALPTTPAIRRAADFKLEKVMELIEADKKSKQVGLNAG
jgi:C-terminal processing protease CtpA/Prc